MSALLPVERTLLGFRAGELANTIKLTSATAFLVSLTTSAQEEDSPSSGLAEFLTTPLIASISDKYSRRPTMVFCLGLIALGRGLLHYLPKQALLPLLVAIGKGGLLACIRANLADFSVTAGETAKSWTKVAVCAALGALFAPVFRRFSMEASPRAPLASLAAVALGMTVFYYAEDEYTLEEKRGSAADLNPVACSPLSFSRLTATRQLSLAAAASFATELVGVEELILASAGANDRLRVRLMSIIGLTSILGTGLSSALQSRFGLQAQARFALLFQLGSAASLVGGEPELAAVLTVLAKRSSDASDVVLFEDAEQGKGERAGALANLKVAGQVAGSIMHAFLFTSLGLEASASFGVLAAVAAEALRTKMAKQ